MAGGEAAAALEAALERTLETVRSLAREVGGERAERAVAPEASLEREVGLGSLERVELLVRLERAFGRALDDRFLEIDTSSALARAVVESSPSGPLRLPAREEAPGPAAEIGGDVRTLHESLFRHARADPDRTHALLRGDEGDEQTISYGRLWDEAAAVGGGLRERGLGRGATVALMLPTGLDFLRSYLGVLLARAVPVPIYPPVRLDRLSEYAARQSAILADAGVRLMITVGRGRPVVSLLRPSVPTLEDVVTADELAATGERVSRPEGEGADPAFIQYTSGSTGRPKGVLLSHDNLLANIRAIGAGLEVKPTDIGVSWLPLYHDMGLIGSWLYCLHHGLPITLLSPTSFLARPERWLWAIHQRRGTHSAAPNFAYELCVRRIPDQALAGLDLSSWRCALNGAEPVSPGTIERFAARFSAYGFRREAMVPGYGLAECSVGLAFPRPGRPARIDRISRAAYEREGRAEPTEDPAALAFVGVGRPLPGHEVKIVDESGAERPERVVGRLVFRGPSMTAGYYGKPEATAAVMLPGGFMDSGDLAYRSQGELFITGRRKDLIIKGGRNLVPQEIEDVAAEVAGVRRGCVVAFGVEHPELGTEGLVVVAETRLEGAHERDRLAGEVTARVAAAIDVPPDRVVLVPPGSVPKTSSGKLRRAETRALYMSGALGRPPRTTPVQKLRLLGAASLEAMRPLLQKAGRGIYALYLAIALPPVVLPLFALVALVPSRRIAAVLGRFAARAVLTLAGCRLTADGLERLPRAPYVLASNHASYADAPALLAMLPVDFLFVAKRELLSMKILGPLVRTYVRRAGHLTVDRFDAQQGLADADAVSRALAAGEIVHFFPEGTFTAASGLRPFRLGAFRAAAAAGRPVVPVALRGTRRVLRGDQWLPHPGPVHVSVAQPVAPAGGDWAAVLRLRDEVANAIAERCGEPRLDLVAAGPERPPTA
jgi:1-acyl-sn-glycerol-3-phosphate acyltransferase